MFALPRISHGLQAITDPVGHPNTNWMDVLEHIEYKLGARGLRSIVETVMVDTMYDLPSSGEKEFTITRDFVLDRLDKAHFDRAHSKE